MTESRGPEGWEAEDYDREKIRELREQGMDPGSVQQKLKSIDHPSVRDLGTDERDGDAEVPVSGSASGEPQIPGADERAMADRGHPTGGANRTDKDAATEAE